MLPGDFLILFVFGFPAGILALLTAVLGIWKKKPVVMVLAGVWAFLAAFYLSVALGFPFYLNSLFLFFGAYALHKGSTRFAWLSLIPSALVACFMTILSYPFLIQSGSLHALFG